MKQITTILFLLLVCLTISSQATKDYDYRIKNGKLTYKECEILVESGDTKSALPSLYNLLEEYENNRPFIYSKMEEYLNVVFCLEEYYNEIGDLSISYQLLDNALELQRSISYNKNTPLDRELFLKRGRIESSLKSYKDALNYYFTAQMMCNVVNDKSDFYIGLLCNISIAYQNINDLLMAKIYVEEAKDLYEKSHGKLFNIKEVKDDLQSYILMTYGQLCFMMKNWIDAEKIYTFLIEIHDDYKIDNTALSIVYNNLSQILLCQNRLNESLFYLKKICNHNSEVDYLVYQNLAWNHLLLGNYIDATACLKQFNTTARKNIVSVFSTFSEMNRESYWNKYAISMITINNLVAFKSQNPDAIIQAYNNTLFCKSLLLGATSALKEYISDSKDPKLKQDYYEYLKFRESLSYKTNDSITKEKIAHELVRKEEEILSSIKGLDKLIDKHSGTWNSIANILNEDEAAIEFCYIVTMDSITNAKGYYGAFIIRKEYTSPRLILLGSINDVEEITQGVDDDIFSINDFYTSQKHRDLYKLTWANIEPYLKDCSTIYYSTTGQLSNINYDIVHDINGIALCDKYKLVRVSSTNKISKVKETNKPTFNSSVLYGGIRYNETLAEMTKNSEQYTDCSSSSVVDGLALRSISNRGSWGELNATKDEISNIQIILKKNGISAQTMTESFANEESFKALSGKSPDIIHLATHGYYISSRKKASVSSFFSQITPYSEKERYMQWSGLLMAGANNAWNGKFALENVEDGILTADEISRLDLSKTQMVVLSACETAKGIVDPVDGVYGLQLAFKRSGVGTIVMSLWKVPDEATSLLMNSFYAALISSIEKHEALKKAMYEVRKKYKDPYYWAGFIMLD